MTKEKKSFVERVVGFLKLDDNGKVEKFQKQAVKVWEKQIEIREAEIAELSEKQTELIDEKAEEIVLNVNVSKLKTIEDREAYILKYQGELLALKARIEEFDALIEEKELEMENFTWLIEQVS